MKKLLAIILLLTLPLSAQEKEKGKLGVDYIEVKRHDGIIEYWRNLNK